MHFEPVILSNIFSKEDTESLLNLVNSEDSFKSWNDLRLNRGIKRYSDLETYFSKKLEPLARNIFNDQTLKTTYSVYVDYNKPTSALTSHRDTNACTYTIDYCLSAKTPWPLIIEEQEFSFSSGEALAFMGGFDDHRRDAMPDPENNRVEMIMFHFCPEDHWYFTEGPEYIYRLQDQGVLDNWDTDTYALSPKIKK